MNKTIAAAACAVLVHATGLAQDGAPYFSIRQDEPNIGTHIKHRIAERSAIPFDKKWSELTPDQQALVKSQYDAMPANDEPPFPVNGLRSIYKPVADAQQRLNAKGHLSMYVEIDSQGKPVSVSVFESPDPQITKVAAVALMLQDYKPAVCNGQPCRMRFPLRISLDAPL